MPPSVVGRAATMWLLVLCVQGCRTELVTSAVPTSLDSGAEPNARATAANSSGCNDASCAGSALPNPVAGAAGTDANVLAATPGDDNTIATAPPAGCDANVTLACAAALSRRYVGAAVNTDALAQDADYALILAQQFNTVTPENAMKWGIIEPAVGQWNYAAADRLVGFAQAHSMAVHGHCLVWYQQTPSWLNASIDAATLRQRMLAQGLRSSVLGAKLGVGYIADAFAAAHAADPNALLFYNDYSLEWNGTKTDRVYNLLKSLVAQGVPIHGIGLQAHLQTWAMPSAASFGAVIDRFVGLGLQVRISEMDVAMDQYGSGSQNDKLAAQADAYSVLAKTCLQRKGCTGIVGWGFTDRYTWLQSYENDPNEQPLPYSASYLAKPAYYSLLRALQAAAP